MLSYYSFSPRVQFSTAGGYMPLDVPTKTLISQLLPAGYEQKPSLLSFMVPSCA